MGWFHIGDYGSYEGEWCYVCIVSILKRFHNINAFEINTHSYTVSIMEHLVVAAQ